jgi:hypothetical protein
MMTSDALVVLYEIGSRRFLIEGGWSSPPLIALSFRQEAS